MRTWPGLPSLLLASGLATLLGAAPTNFITGYALNAPPLRNDFAGWVGMKLTVGAAPLLVSSLGRICAANNSATHLVKFVKAADGSDVSGAAVLVNMTGCTAGQFVYGAVSTVTLAAGASYFLVSQESNGGDRWYDQGALSATNDAAVNSSVYFYGGNWIPINSANTSYVPPTFQYSIGTPVSQYLLTTNVLPVGGGSVVANPSSATGSYDSGTVVQLTAMPASGCTFVNWSGVLSGTPNPQSLTMSAPQTVTANFQCTTPPTSNIFLGSYGLSNPPLRNDFTGWVGMKLTLGANPLVVTSLGRVCTPNNSATHLVKFVNAGDGSDVPGGSASLSMAGCTAGQFVYSPIASVSLAAGASYYLASQELYGGDRWYDFGTVSASSAATVNSAVYFYGGNWISIGSANTSYVPVNFQYAAAGQSTSNVTVQANPGGPSFSVDGVSYATSQAFNWNAGSAHMIATTSPQSAGAGTQYVWNSWSDSGAISHSVMALAGSAFTATFTTQYLLTSNVSPGGGSLAANPSSAAGYYAAGTGVQLTATANAGCMFVNWSGALSGAANPQTVTMSAPQTVTANFQCSGPTGTSFLTGYALNGPSVRNDFTGWVGMKLTVGASPLTVSALGRICIAGNTGTHTVKLVNAGDGSDVGGASVSLNMAGCVGGQFVYGAINSTALPTSKAYYLVSQEAQGADLWYDQGGISATTAAVVNNAVYFYGGNWFSIGAANTSYVPANFQYSVSTQTQYTLTANVSPAGGGSIATNPASASANYNAGTNVQLTATAISGCTFLNWSGALSGITNPQTVTMSGPQAVTANFQCTAQAPATSFVTGYALDGPGLRNDFSGWVGMQLGVRTYPVIVSALGRACVAGNGMTHTVKFVNVSDGSAVAGGSALVNMAGCTLGQFAYTPVPPITLPAGASYYLVSQETQGGDRWYDQGRISATNAALVNNSVYFYGGNWNPINAANTSYVPPNFQYSIVSNSGGAPTDLAGYWSFDPAYVSGTTLLDQSSYANDATAYSIAFVPGKIGQAIQLNGASSYAQVALADQLDLLNDLSLSVWIKTLNASRGEGVISKYDAGGSEYGYILRTTAAGTAEMQFGSSNVLSGNRVVTDITRINDGNWHHVAVVVKLGVNVSFFIDGVPSSTTALATVGLTASAPFSIGVNPYTYYGNYFTGSIDEVRVYKRALSASEIFSLYNPAASGGGTAPAVAITSPTPSTLLSGSVTVSANASANAGVSYVAFQLDGVGILPGLTAAPYSVSWNTMQATSGPHTLSALAMDTLGNLTVSAPVNVTITNPPVLGNSVPSGLWPAGTNQLTLALTTNEAATCRYSTTPATNYGAMAGTFATTSGTSQSTTLSGLTNGQAYTYYVRCQDAYGYTNTTDYAISFSIAGANISNGLAQTPPMGWNSWNYFREGISDTLIKQIADALVSSGMQNAGYRYVIIDGGWEGQRDGNGALQANSNFPDMKGLADYVHSQGLKLGIYSSPGPLTCDGLPGSYGHEQQDANTFAQWGVDYLKYDLCSADTVYPSSQFPVVYKLMGDALLATGRAIVFSLCEYGDQQVWTWGASVDGNLWRTTSDIEDNWNTMSGIGFSQNNLAPYAGPGHWNDPDMLEIGNGGMTADEYRTHLSLWSILAAPLLAGNDVRNMTADTMSILLNTEVIAIDQDAAGIQGHRLSVSGNQEIWVKPLAGGSIAVGLFNRDSQAANISVALSDLGFTGQVSARDLWAHQAVTFQNGVFQATVVSHGVVMLRVDPVP